MKKFCESLKEHAIEKIDFKKKKMKLLTKELHTSNENGKSVFADKTLKTNTWEIKNIVKLEVIVIMQGNIEVLSIAYVILNIVCLKTVSLAFQNGTSNDYHFIIKELAEKK